MGVATVSISRQPPMAPRITTTIPAQDGSSPKMRWSGATTQEPSSTTPAAMANPARNPGSRNRYISTRTAADNVAPTAVAHTGAALP